MAGQQQLVTDEIRAWIGKSAHLGSREILARDIRRYAIALDDPNPIYRDEEYARSTPYGGIIAPPLFLRAIFRDDTAPLSKLHPDGTADTSETLEPPLPVHRRIEGGSEYLFLKPVRPGDVISAVSQIEDIGEKDSRLGRMILVTTKTTYNNQDGEVVMVARTTGIRF